MCHSEGKHIFGETQLLYDIYRHTKCIHVFTEILNTCEKVNIELCTRFLSYKNYFCRTISVCNARSPITMFHT